MFFALLIGRVVENHMISNPFTNKKTKTKTARRTDGTVLAKTHLRGFNLDL